MEPSSQVYRQLKSMNGEQESEIAKAAKGLSKC